MIGNTLGMGRRMSDGLMSDTCKVTRTAGVPVLDEETGVYTPAEPTTIYEGPFRSKGVNVAPAEIDAAAQLLVEMDAQLSFPMEGTGGITKNDIVTWVTSGFDPALVGQSVRCGGPFALTTHSVARRFRVEQTT